MGAPIFVFFDSLHLRAKPGVVKHLVVSGVLADAPQDCAALDSIQGALAQWILGIPPVHDLWALEQGK